MDNNKVMDQILTQCQQAYSEAGEGRNDWTPPPSPTNYTCLIQDFAGGTATDKKTGQPKIWYKPIFMILDGEFEGQTFEGDYAEITPGSKSVFKTKQTARVLNSGEVIDDLGEAYKFILSHAGSTVEVQVRQNGRFLNRNIVRLVKAATAAAV